MYIKSFNGKSSHLAQSSNDINNSPSKGGRISLLDKTENVIIRKSCDVQDHTNRNDQNLSTGESSVAY